MVPSKPVDASRTIMTELVMPNDTNPLGDLMGGNLMRWMDIAGGICAARHCEAHVVTASVDHVSFRKPINVGNVVTLNACVTRAFNTSVEVFVQVRSGVITEGQSGISNHAYLTFVALDPYNHKPKPVPRVEPKTQEEQDLYDGAERRREVRLVLAGRIEAKDAVAIRKMFAETEKDGK